MYRPAMDRTVALLDSDASDVWLSPAVGAVADSGPPAGESQSGDRVSKRQGWFAHQRAPPRRPRVRGWVSRPVIAMNTVLSHTQRRLRLVARVSAVQGGAADHSGLGAVVRPGAAASSGYRSPINAERNNYPTWLDFRGALQLRGNTLMFQRPLSRSRGICCGNGGKQLTDCGGLKLLICTRLQYRRVSDR